MFFFLRDKPSRLQTFCISFPAFSLDLIFYGERYSRLWIFGGETAKNLNHKVLCDEKNINLKAGKVLFEIFTRGIWNMSRQGKCYVTMNFEFKVSIDFFFHSRVVSERSVIKEEINCFVLPSSICNRCQVECAVIFFSVVRLRTWPHVQTIPLWQAHDSDKLRRTSRFAFGEKVHLGMGKKDVSHLRM